MAETPTVQEQGRALKFKATRLYQVLADSKAPTFIHVGGAGSGKSYATAQYILTKLFSQPNGALS